MQHRLVREDASTAAATQSDNAAVLLSTDARSDRGSSALATRQRMATRFDGMHQFSPHAAHWLPQNNCSTDCSTRWRTPSRTSMNSTPNARGEPRLQGKNTPSATHSSRKGADPSSRADPLAAPGCTRPAAGARLQNSFSSLPSARWPNCEKTCGSMSSAKARVDPSAKEKPARPG